MDERLRKIKKNYETHSNRSKFEKHLEAHKACRGFGCTECPLNDVEKSVCGFLSVYFNVKASVTSVPEIVKKLMEVQTDYWNIV